MSQKELMRNSIRRCVSARDAVVAFAVVIASAAVMSCGGSDATSPPQPPVPPPTVCTPGNGTVCITTSNTFDPTNVTISSGESVTWVNLTGVTHNVTFDTTGAPLGVPNFASGAKVVTFPAKGRYPYHCTIHGGSMSGTVTVQ